MSNSYAAKRKAGYAYARRLAAWLISRNARSKLLVAVIADAVVLALCAALAVLLTTKVPASVPAADWLLVALGPPLVVVAFYVVGAYRAVIRYIGAEFIGRSAIAFILASLPLIAFYQPEAVAGSRLQTLAVFILLAEAALMALRVTARWMLSSAIVDRSRGFRVLIYGAGDGGAQMAAALRLRGLYRPIGFVDDRLSLKGRTILGLPVYAPFQLQHLKSRGAFDQILLAIPSLSRVRRRELLEMLEPLATQVLVMPGLDDLASGRKRVDELREVQIEDLLDRDPVPPVAGLLEATLFDKTVLITGAGGSIGSELSRQALTQGARKLVLLDVCEYGLYAIDRELRQQAPSCEIVPVLGSVLDAKLLKRLFSAEHVDTVYHAAAYKHVPMVETNVLSAVLNNVCGTFNVTKAAISAGVKHFVLISTDKAVRPANVMGASKRMCELLVQALAKEHSRINMCMVRFGNVLASSGSVVPLFREQIRQGGPVTVTHPDVTRYFMTIPEAAQLVIQAGAMGRHGEVYLLEMGEAVKIRSLAERMIHLSGLTVKDMQGCGDVEITYTGLRPGEKLYEELLIGQQSDTTSHPRIFKASENFYTWDVLHPLLQAVFKAAERDDEEQVVALMEKCVTGFVRKSNKEEVSSPSSAALKHAPQMTYNDDGARRGIVVRQAANALHRETTTEVAP